MKLLITLLCTTTAWVASDAAPCTSAQLAAAAALTSDAGLARACPSISGTDLFTGVAPCADAGCASYLSTLSGRLPDCEVDGGVNFKDLFTAFVGVCRDNAASTPQPTRATTTAPPTTAPVVTTMPPATTATTTTVPPVINATTTIEPPTNATSLPAPTTPLPTTTVPALNQTNTTTDGNATAVPAPDADAVDGSVTPALPAPAPASLATRPTLVGVAVMVVTALTMASVV